MSEHTPTPWVVEATHSATAILQKYVKEGESWKAIATAVNKEDAAFIVRAVNSHGPMLEGLKEALENVQRIIAVEEKLDTGPSLEIKNTETILQRAIAKAEGK